MFKWIFFHFLPPKVRMFIKNLKRFKQNTSWELKKKKKDLQINEKDGCFNTT